MPAMTAPADSPEPGTSRAIRACLVMACLALASGLALTLGGVLPMPQRLLALNPNAFHPFFAYATGGLFVMHWMVRGATAAVRRASLIGIALFAAHAVALGMAAPAHQIVGTAVYYQGIGSALVLAASLRRRGSSPGPDLDILLAGAVMPVLVLASRFYLDLSMLLAPVTRDVALFRFDGSLGLQASALLAASMRRLPGAEELARFAYAGLPLMAACAIALQLRSHRRTGAALLGFVAIGLAGYLIYFLYPAAGPVYLLGPAFPVALPDPAMLAPDMVPAVPAPRNAMPSLHMAWAVAMCLSVADRGPRWRLAFAAFAVLTAYATLALGEHYLVDLVIAVPFALAVHAACDAASLRAPRRALLGGAVLTAAWLAYLTGTPDFAARGAAHWIAMVLTLLLCRRLGTAHVRHGTSAADLPPNQAARCRA